MVLQLVQGFEALRSIVKQISEGPTFENVDELRSLLRETSPQTLNKLQDFLFVSLFKNIYGQGISTELKCQLLECMHIILLNIRVTSTETGLRVLSFLMSPVFDSKEPEMVASVPEEFKLVTMKCAAALIKSISEDIYLDLYKMEHLPALSHAIYICATMAKFEKLQDLRVASMEVIMSLCGTPATGTVDMSDPEDRRVIGDALQFILPGLATKLLHVVRGPITQGSKVTATAVRTLGGAISVVMEDYNVEDVEPSAESIMALVKSSMTQTRQEPTGESPKSLDQKQRDSAKWDRTVMASKGRQAEWRSNTETKLLPVLDEMGSLQTHSHWKVRKEVVWASAMIIVRCPRSLYKGLPAMLDALVYLKGDDQPEVHELCVKTLSEIQSIFSSRASKSFNELVEENMYHLLSSLPRLVQEDCGQNTPRVISLLAGYIEILGSRLNLMLHSAVHLQRFSLSVLQALTVECFFVSLASDYSFKELKAFKNCGLEAPYVRMRYCGDKEAINQISRLVSTLSAPEIGDAFELIGRQCLALITAIPSVTNEAALFLNLLLRSGQGEKCHRLASLALDVYLEPKVYSLSALQGLSLNQSQRGVIRACLFTEGIACCITAMDSYNLHPSLLRGIYPLLEQAGSANDLISSAGMAALTLLSAALGHGDNLAGFLDSYMDYISYSLSTRLKDPSKNPGVYDALTLLLKHATASTLPGIRDIIRDVSLRSCDKHNEEHVKAQLRVYNTFAVCMRTWLRGESGAIKENVEDDDVDDVTGEDDSPKRLPNIAQEPAKWDVVELVVIYHNCLKQFERSIKPYRRRHRDRPLGPREQPHVIAENLRREYKEMQLEPEVNEEKQPPPAEVLLLDSVLRRSVNMIASSDHNTQFLALSTIATGMKTLSSFTDVLLPLAHVTWAPLVGRLRRDQDPLVIRTAFELLYTMSKTCKDFLRPRIVKEIFPELCSILQSTVSKSHLQEKDSAYRISQLYKLQKSILSKVGPLCTHLKLRGPDFRPIVMACMPYLSRHQPRPLQKLCVNLMKYLKLVDHDLVWWNIAIEWGPEDICRSIEVPPGKNYGCAEIDMLLDL